MASTSNNTTEVEAIIEEAIRNELILQSIFQQLPIRELKNCRHICAKWNNLALKEIQVKNWNDRNILNFEAQVDQRILLETYLDFFCDAPASLPYSCHKLGYFMNTHHYKSGTVPTVDKDLVEKFCQTFKKQMRGVDIRNGVPMCAQDILEICGESLEELGISLYTINVYPDLVLTEYPSNLEIKESFKNQILLPKLKSISVGMRIGQTEEGNVLNDCNQIFKNILSHMRPNSLEELNFHNFGQFHSAVESLIEFNQINELQKLAIYPNPDFQKGSLLMFKKRGINLRLKQLRIHNTKGTSSRNCSDVDPNELYEFLVTQKKSLHNLNLICSTYSFPSNMVAIKTLEIRVHGKELGMEVNTLTINFAESFPNLKTLCMWKNWDHHGSYYRGFWNSDEQIISEQNSCYSLEKLTLALSLTLSVGPIARILRTFPRLSSLEIEPISCEGFQAIWNSEEFADTLKVLILWISGIPKGGPVYMENALQLDEIFSGVSRHEVGNVNAKKYSETFILAESRPNSILKLKNLKKLHLNFLEKKGGNQVHLLTDFAGDCIFDKMKNLINLFIHQNTHRFSDLCIAKLQTNVLNFSCDNMNEELNGSYFWGCEEHFLKARMSRRRMYL